MANNIRYNDVFSMYNIIKFLKYIRKKEYVIEPKKDKQLLFYPIYSLKQIKLNILKIYIKGNTTNIFF